MHRGSVVAVSPLIVADAVRSRGFGIVSVLVGLCLTCISGSVLAQTPNYAMHERGQERVNEARNVAPLNVDQMFGAQLSMYNGGVGFNVVDVEIPGDSALPVEFRRKLDIVDRRETTGTLGWFDHFGGNADWDLDIPHLSGTFAASTGWQVAGSSPNNRCSNTYAPEFQGYFVASSFWNGYALNVPGQGTRTLLARATNSPLPVPAGAAHPWVTKDLWVLTCKPGTANGYPGEAFIAISPDGVRYHLDHVVTRQASSSRTTVGNTQAFLARVTVYFLVTRVEDRFGNWVNYAWSGDRLQSIAANDGRRIDLSYNGNGWVSSVTSSKGIWSYGYASNRLSQVTRPDASKWQYAAEGRLNLSGAPSLPSDDWLADCPDNFDGVGGWFAYTVRHPSGASTRFDFEGRRHYRSNVVKYCEKPSNTYEYLQIPNYSDNFTLVKRTLSGPGLQVMVWQYTYGNGDAGFASDCAAGNAYLCPASKEQRVDGPGGRWERYVYGLLYGVNEGQLLSKEIGEGVGAPLEAEQYTYLPESAIGSQVFPSTIGNEVRNFSDPLANAKIRPLIERRSQRSGTGYRWRVDSCGAGYCFDIFARTTRFTESSEVIP